MKEARALLAAATPRRISLPERGVEIAVLDWGGEGPLALLHHANGFCKGVFARVAEGLRQDFRVVAMDARGHGDSSQVAGPDAFAWPAFAQDLGAVAERLTHEAGRPIALGLGHSFGGTAMLAAAAMRPELFERLLLVDPVISPPLEVSPPERLEHMNRMVDAARNRRAEFASRAEARAWWAQRSLFADWQAEALDLYVLDGLRETDRGSVVLKCPGRVEAAVFGATERFDLQALAPRVRQPTLWLWAARGNFPREAYEALAGQMVAARVESLDVGHLIPMERPDLVVEAARRLVGEGVEGIGPRSTVEERPGANRR
jgi:pimeloyl-ACP methyl ester carboxylesterase